MQLQGAKSSKSSVKRLSCPSGCRSIFLPESRTSLSNQSDFQNIFERTPKTSRISYFQQLHWDLLLSTDSCPSSSYAILQSYSHRPATPKAMAWMSTGSTNAALIKNLTSNGLITSERVKNAMLAVCYQIHLHSPFESLDSLRQQSSYAS